MGKTLYDSTQRILWTSARVNYAGVGNIKMLAGGHLSEDGFVQILGYARDEDFSKYEALLHEIISTVELPEGMRYVPRGMDNMPLVHMIDWGKALSKGIVGAVLGGAAALIFGLRKRKKMGSQQDD